MYHKAWTWVPPPPGPGGFNLALRFLTCRYLCYLFFQLKTHADELAEGGGDEAPALSLFGALAMLTCITLVVATNSEYVSLALCTQALSPSLRPLHIAIMNCNQQSPLGCACLAGCLHHSASLLPVCCCVTSAPCNMPVCHGSMLGAIFWVMQCVSISIRRPAT